jgi:hypothetical protein
MAKRELLKALDGLDQNSFFNIVTFSSGVSPWKDRIRAEERDHAGRGQGVPWSAWPRTGARTSTARSRWPSRIRTSTRSTCSRDGEPSVGRIIDPQGIRDRVAAWNRHRGVVINCIAVGGSFQVLEWLAEDTGGTHVRFP